MKTLATITLTILIAVIMCVTGQAQEPFQTIGINPTGLAIDGFSCIEYERQIKPATTIVLRLNNIRYDYEESEYSYDYSEEGNGFGIGVGSKYYINANNENNGLFVGSNLDFVSVDWSWEEFEGYGYYSGEGTTTAMAFSAQFGYKAMLTHQLSIAPAFIMGWASLNVEGIQGIGFFYTPSITMSMQF